MDSEGVNRCEWKRSGIFDNAGMLTMKRRQVLLEAEDKGFIIAIRPAKLLQYFLFHRRAFVGSEVAVLYRENLLDQRFQIEEIPLVPVGRGKTLHSFDFRRVILHRLVAQK